MTLLLLWGGAQAAAGAPDLFANASGTLTLTGFATADLEIDREYIPGGAGREEFRPRFERPRPAIAANAAATLVLTGRARAVLAPELAHSGLLVAKPSPRRVRPPEEEREFRLLATAKGRLSLVGGAGAMSSVEAESWADLEIHGGSTVESSWPDDTAELVCLMLMLDLEAA